MKRPKRTARNIGTKKWRREETIGPVTERSQEIEEEGGSEERLRSTSRRFDPKGRGGLL